MKTNYNVTGSERKKLVGAISEILGMPVKYLGAPTFAYEVACCHIDKTGTITGTTGKHLVEALAERGFIGEVIEAAVEPVEAAGEPDRITIEMPLDGFDERAMDNLKKLIASKAELIRKAFGDDLAAGAETLPVERSEIRLEFPWFRLGLEPPEFVAYTWFITALCATAKKQKRVTAKEKDVDNEKFTFRVFLLRLGFVGDEYKAARKIMLRNLSGNSAFKSGAPPQKVKASSNE